jgi:RNA polymerase sigma-70 factor, ECF subfamily
MPTEARTSVDLSAENYEMIDLIYARCVENAPNYGVRPGCFKDSLLKTISKYLGSSGEPDSGDVDSFLTQVQADDLFLALACANGNERAWWEFDQQHRSYLERVARHLAKTEVDAQEVIDQVYVELYGTKIVDGERVSKFSTYSGRGSLRGWLRTVIWHSLVDLHRASHDEVSLDEMTENVGEGMAHASFAETAPGGEDEMIDHLARERYRKATVSALETAFSSLEEHEKLLLMFYHVENLKLREIARLVEAESSPLRGWFQRRSQSRSDNPSGRIHESTIMRWLEKSYARVLQLFKTELSEKSGLGREEIDICLGLATEDLAGNNLFKNLSTS